MKKQICSICHETIDDDGAIVFDGDNLCQLCLMKEFLHVSISENTS